MSVKDSLLGFESWRWAVGGPSVGRRLNVSGPSVGVTHPRVGGWSHGPGPSYISPRISSITPSRSSSSTCIFLTRLSPVAALKKPSIWPWLTSLFSSRVCTC